MEHITFELEQTKDEKERYEKFKIIEGLKDYPFNAQKVIIKKDGKIIGHIFTPSGSGNNNKNSIQICGFTEAFDYWGCGVFDGYKDIQLLFDDGMMGGKSSDFSFEKCLRCYRHPCQCENKIPIDGSHEEAENQKVVSVPFNIKTSTELKDRIIQKR